MASKIIQYFTNMLKTDKIYPVTVTKAVYHTDGSRLDDRVTSLLATASEVTTLESTVSQINSNLMVKEWTLTPSMFASDTEKEDFPYKGTYSTNVYTNNFIPLSCDIIPSDGSAFLSEDEMEWDNSTSTNKFAKVDTSGFHLWVTDIPTCNLTFRVIGVG